MQGSLYRLVFLIFFLLLPSWNYMRHVGRWRCESDNVLFFPPNPLNSCSRFSATTWRQSPLVACGQGGVGDGVLGVAGEGHGDGVAGPPRHFLHAVEVLRARGEEADSSCIERSKVGGGGEREFDRLPHCRREFNHECVFHGSEEDVQHWHLVSITCSYL